MASSDNSEVAEEREFLRGGEKYCFCVIEMNRADVWLPVGIREIKDSSNDFDGACDLAEHLCERGRLTCIDPTSPWTFITIDAANGPFRVRPFTLGRKDADYITDKFAGLKKDAAERLSELRRPRKQSDKAS